MLGTPITYLQGLISAAIMHVINLVAHIWFSIKNSVMSKYMYDKNQSYLKSEMSSSGMNRYALFVARTGSITMASPASQMEKFSFSKSEEHIQLQQERGA